MLAQVSTATILGVEALHVSVEVDVAFGLPGLTIVGLAGGAVLEARDRVRSAIRNSDFEVPSRRITVNLAPADLLHGDMLLVMRAALYARLSRDRDGTSTGTDRQLADCRRLAAAKGWEIGAEYVERDVSAYSARTPRPAYEAMVGELEAGTIDVIVAWKLDRLLRRPLDFEQLWVRLERQGASLVTVADAIDTTQPIVGELVPRLLTTFAKLESQNLSTREKRKHEETAAAGRRAGGGHRPFGLSADWSAIVDDEADAIRAAVAGVVAGELSLYAIAADWNARGIRTTTGRAWTPQLVRSMLGSPRLAGAREHRGELIASGAIPAIITLEQHRALLGVLSRRQPTGAAGRFLLSGLLRCATCGGPMYARRRHKDKRRFYGCEKMPGGAGCGGVHIVAEPLEHNIEARFLAALDSPEVAAAIRTREEETAAGDELGELQADEASLRQLADDHYVARLIGRDEYLAAREPLEQRIASRRGRLSRRAGTRLAAAAAADPAARWEAMDLPLRRALLSELIEAIDVGPASRRGAPFEPERAGIRWRY